MIQHYLEKQQFLPQLSAKPKSEVYFSIVIPSFKEEGLFDALHSLKKCHSPKCHVEVIVVLNLAENSEDWLLEMHQKQEMEIQSNLHQLNTDKLTFYAINACNIPRKIAGVGNARKLGMDEAASRLLRAEREDGWIVCFDADASCNENYLVELEHFFNSHSEAKAASIYFEHQFESDKDPIVLYELHLRYYRQAMKWAGHPHAFHTVGSSMAVKAEAYAAQSGMNKKKAGEDFYFLQKHIPQKGFVEINTTVVFPSSRTSDRVPFGTGRSMLEFAEGKDLSKTYPFQAFLDIKLFLEQIDMEYVSDQKFGTAFLQRVPQVMLSFLEENGFEERVPDLLSYGKTLQTFHHRFYNWFGAFRAMKYIHFARDTFYGAEDLENASQVLLQKLQRSRHNSLLGLLQEYRYLDRNP